MLKNSSNKKLSRIMIIFFILLVAMIGGVSAKYIHDAGTTKNVVRAKEFYFTSDLLSEEGKDYYLNADANSVNFTLGNNADELRFSEDNIEYMVTVTLKDGATDDEHSLNLETNPVLEGGKVSYDLLSLSGLDKDKTYIVTAVGKSVYINPETNERKEGYEKTLTATFTLANDDASVYKHLEKKDAYVLLTVWAKNLEGTLQVEYVPGEGESTLIPDNTDPVMKNVKNYENGNYGTVKFTDGTSFAEKYSSYTYRFFIDNQGSISVNDFTVLLNTHVAEESEPK